MSSPNRPSRAEAARLAGWLELAARGWALFPVLPGQKRPAFPAWGSHATTDPERLTRFFTAHPTHNAGIACGPSGLLIIDCDTPKPDDPGDVEDGWSALTRLAADRGGLPDTWTVVTPSGGRHLYFRAPAPPARHEPLGNTHGEIADRLDTRGDGGQVLAPGSRLPNGAYELLDDSDPADLPGWLVWTLAVRASTAVSAPAERPSTVPAHREAYLSAVVRAELQRVAQAQPRGHNEAVYTAARNLGRYVAGHVLDRASVKRDLLDAARHIISGPCDCTARGITASIRSGLDRGELRPRELPAPRERRSA